MSEQRQEEGEIPRMDSADMVLLIQKSIREMQPQLTYHEGPRDLEVLCSILKWGAGIASSLAVAGIIGGIVMYGNVQEMRTEIAGLRHEIDDVKKIVEPRYRGGEDASSS